VLCVVQMRARTQIVYRRYSERSSGEPIEILKLSIDLSRHRVCKSSFLNVQLLHFYSIYISQT